MLTGKEVHIWSLDEEHLPSWELSASLCSEAEYYRSNRFVLNKDKIFFLRSKAALRILLGFYLNTDPKYIRYEYNNLGKPKLMVSTDTHKNMDIDNNLKFNLSHSKNYLSIAITRNTEIGIDIEVKEEKGCFNFLDLSKTFRNLLFSTEEVEAISGCPLPDRYHTFYQWWTMKEALSKGLGLGFTYPLHHHSLTANSNQQSVIDVAHYELWHLLNLVNAKLLCMSIATQIPHPCIIQYADSDFTQLIDAMSLETHINS